MDPLFHPLRGGSPVVTISQGGKRSRRDHASAAAPPSREGRYRRALHQVARRHPFAGASKGPCTSLHHLGQGQEPRSLVCLASHRWGSQGNRFDGRLIALGWVAPIRTTWTVGVHPSQAKRVEGWVLYNRSSDVPMEIESILPIKEMAASTIAASMGRVKTKARVPSMHERGLRIQYLHRKFGGLSIYYYGFSILRR